MRIVVIKCQDSRGIVEADRLAGKGRRVGQCVAGGIVHRPFVYLISDNFVLRFDSPTQRVGVWQFVLAQDIRGADNGRNMVAGVFKIGAVTA